MIASEEPVGGNEEDISAYFGDDSSIESHSDNEDFTDPELLDHSSSRALEFLPPI